MPSMRTPLTLLVPVSNDQLTFTPVSSHVRSVDTPAWMTPPSTVSSDAEANAKDATAVPPSTAAMIFFIFSPSRISGRAHSLPATPR
ncbi:hypothetical protein DV701_09755 [Ornithinimicrobium avium]|uniref:Uncharacterized protein n=1 Tax=Ornithinimicrobium avium TaxID=2283195 RepID=A0A345NMV6_9MICO|nr:hypothetical protein DV701_09755 [Ornithinimicrobium avium]